MTKTTEQENKKLKIYIVTALILVYIFWGGTYLGMKIAIETMPPFLMAGIRFVLAGIALYAFSRLRGADKPTSEHWKNTGIVGALLLLGGNGVVCWAEQLVPSSIAALLIATVPLWIILLGWLGDRASKPNMGVIIGVAMGMLGIGVLVLGTGGTGSSSISIIGIAALLFAAFSWSLGSMYSRKAVMPASALLSTAMQMLVGGALLVVVSFFLGEWSKVSLTDISLRSLAALGYLVFFGSIVGYNAYIWLLKNAEPALVSTYAFVNPVVAVMLGWVFAGEKLTSNALLAAVIIIAAVVIITIFRNSKKPAKVDKEQIKVQ